MSESEELQRARGGDRAAYEALFAGVAERLLLYLEVRLGGLRSRLDACDVLQETFLAAHRSFGSFQGRTRAAFRAWLFTIADHRLGELAAHHGAQKRGVAREVPAIVEQLRASRTGPATACARLEQQDRLRAALEALEADQREAVLLHHFHGLTQDEAAARLGRTVKQVRLLLAKARYQLGSALEDPAGRPGA